MPCSDGLTRLICRHVRRRNASRPSHVHPFYSASVDSSRVPCDRSRYSIVIGRDRLKRARLIRPYEDCFNVKRPYSLSPLMQSWTRVAKPIYVVFLRMVLGRDRRQLTNVNACRRTIGLALVLPFGWIVPRCSMEGDVRRDVAAIACCSVPTGQ